jgi:hypothetical protein
MAALRAVFSDRGGRFRRPKISFSWITRSLISGKENPADKGAATTDK